MSNNRKRRNKSKKNIVEIRDSGLRSVSTNVEKKEPIIIENSNSNLERNEAQQKNQKVRNNRRNQLNKQRNELNKPTSELDSTQKKVPFNKLKKPNPNNSVTSKDELKRQFLKNELMKYLAPKRKKLHKTLLNRKELAPYVTASKQIEICSICSKNITNMSTVIYDVDKDVYSHFDCLFDQVRQRYPVNDSERIAYVGNGTFAIIEDYKEGNQYKFRIKQKIQVVAASSLK